MKAPLGCIFIAVALALGAIATAAANTAQNNVTRATLDNGLRVVIVRDTLAPVVTTEMNYLVGSDETPPGFPGTAHAVEHMLFRGSPGLSKDQLYAVAADMGGIYNAHTKPGVTSYFFTVPAHDLDVALHVAAIRMRGVDMTRAGWSEERGAIEQEVARDTSNPLFDLQQQEMTQLYADTPYAHAPLGTRPSFNQTTAAMLKRFYDRWYAPNNAILVIVGDVDPAVALKQVKTLFDSIPRKTLPPRPPFHFQPVIAKTIRVRGNLPYGLVELLWRMPGMRSKGYATALVLAKAMASKRGALYAMGLTGKALGGGFAAGFRPHAGNGGAAGLYRQGGNPQTVLKTMQSIIAQISAEGVPAALVKSAKNRLIADLEFQKNSIMGLAETWSATLALHQDRSPDDLRAAIAVVTPAEVDALAKRVFSPAHTITLISEPAHSGIEALIGALVKRTLGARHTNASASAAAHPGGMEAFRGKPGGPVRLPTWAPTAFARLTLPEIKTHPYAFTLDNGLRLIVQPESVNRTVEVFGKIKTNADMQAPKGQKGVAQVLNTLFKFGTTRLNRLQFQTALDAIGAQESAGTSFSLMVPSNHLTRGLQLLAANELHPAMSPRVFTRMRHQLAVYKGDQLRTVAFQQDLNLDRALLPPDSPGLRYATPGSINALTLADVKAYKQQVFRPDMTTIVVIGDVTPDKARKVIEASFGSWKATGPKPITDYPATPPNKPRRFRTANPAATQDVVTLDETIPMTENNPQRWALELGNQILGGRGLHSRLMRDLRVNTGLVYSVNSLIDLSKNGGTFSVIYGCDPNKTGQAHATVIHDLMRMQTTPVSAAELRVAKREVLGEMAVSQSSFPAIARILLDNSLRGRPLNSMDITAHQFFNMTPGQIQVAFEKYIRPHDFITAVTGPAPM